MDLFEEDAWFENEYLTQSENLQDQNRMPPDSSSARERPESTRRFRIGSLIHCLSYSPSTHPNPFASTDSSSVYDKEDEDPFCASSSVIQSSNKSQVQGISVVKQKIPNWDDQYERSRMVDKISKGIEEIYKAGYTIGILCIQHGEKTSYRKIGTKFHSTII